IVGVTKPLDLTSVTAEPNEITLEPGGKAEIDVTIARSEGFTDPVTLAMSFDYFSNKLGEQLPPGVTVGKASSLRLAGGTLKGKVVLEASPTATPVEKLPISVLARVSITFSITTNYGSNPIYLTIPARAKTAQKKPGAGRLPSGIGCAGRPPNTPGGDNSILLLPLEDVRPVHIALHTPHPHDEIASLKTNQGRPAQFTSKELNSAAERVSTGRAVDVLSGSRLVSLPTRIGAAALKPVLRDRSRDDASDAEGKSPLRSEER